MRSKVTAFTPGDFWCCRLASNEASDHGSQMYDPRHSSRSSIWKITP
jgi:hypothetical protein